MTWKTTKIGINTEFFLTREFSGTLTMENEEGKLLAFTLWYDQGEEGSEVEADRADVNLDEAGLEENDPELLEELIERACEQFTDAQHRFFELREGLGAQMEALALQAQDEILSDEQ